jgi:hypothetical protein
MEIFQIRITDFEPHAQPRYNRNATDTSILKLDKRLKLVVRFGLLIPLFSGIFSHIAIGFYPEWNPQPFLKQCREKISNTPGKNRI